MKSSRFQDLSREQAFGLEARILLRQARLMVVSDNASNATVETFFTDLLSLIYKLFEVSLGNTSIENTQEFGQDYYNRLNHDSLFQEKYQPAAGAGGLVTDALGQMDLIRYFFVPGLSEHDRKYPDVANLLGIGGLTLSRIGLKPTAFNEPAEIDCGLILMTRKGVFPYVTPQFFSRPIWPTEKAPDSNDGMPFVVERVIFRDWRDTLTARGLGGVAASYDATTDGVFVTQTNGPEHGETQSGSSAMTDPASLESKPGSRRAVILTALEVETRAVLRHLKDVEEKTVKQTVFHVGQFEGWTIAVAECGPGNVRAAGIVERGIDYFSPEVACFVGVGGGVKDVAIGHVVVATKIYGYESGKAGKDGFQPRPETGLPAYAFEQRARTIRLKDKWKEVRSLVKTR
jgi:hypothetical protein